jgi:hypothetical protein
MCLSLGQPEIDAAVKEIGPKAVAVRADSSDIADIAHFFEASAPRSGSRVFQASSAWRTFWTADSKLKGEMVAGFWTVRSAISLEVYTPNHERATMTSERKVVVIGASRRIGAQLSKACRHIGYRVNPDGRSCNSLSH